MYISHFHSDKFGCYQPSHSIVAMLKSCIF